MGARQVAVESDMGTPRLLHVEVANDIESRAKIPVAAEGQSETAENIQCVAISKRLPWAKDCDGKTQSDTCPSANPPDVYRKVPLPQVPPRHDQNLVIVPNAEAEKGLLGTEAIEELEGEAVSDRNAQALAPQPQEVEAVRLANWETQICAVA